MTTIVGIDGALASTGLAVWRDGRISVRTIRTFPGRPAEERWRLIGAQIWPALEAARCLTLLESVYAGEKVPRTALDLAMVHAVIRLGLHVRGVPCVLVDPQAIKQYAVGSGRAGKQEMVDATARIGLGWKVGDDHQADALWLVAMALDHYGSPLCSASDAGREALRRLAWPHFTLDGRQ